MTPGPFREVPRVPRRQRQASKILTPAESRVVDLVGEGGSNREIAAQMNTTVDFVKNRLRSVFRKLGLDGRLAVALYARSRRLKNPAP